MAYKFKLDIVDPDNHIVTIKPTRGTWMKWLFWSTFPSMVVYGAVAVAYIVTKEDDGEELDLDFIDTDPT